MKYTFVGDIHGKVECVDEALSKEGKKIFVGDFMDSFDLPAVKMGECLYLVIEAIKNGEAEAIFGNHELSYLMNHHVCSGYSEKNRTAFEPYKKDVLKYFKPHLLLSPSLLITHAGLTKQIWDENSMSLETVNEDLNRWWLHGVGSPVHWIGVSRGGYNPVGGTFWCDFNRDFQPIPGLTQIFGHTAGKGIRKVENSYCIDCLDNEHSYLEIEI